MFFFFIRRSMAWTEQHGVSFLREILHIQLWIHHDECVERGQAWDEITAILNSLVEEPFLKVIPRSFRDRYSPFVKKYKSKWRAKDKTSGIAPNYIEIDEALHDLIQRFDEADSARQSNSWKIIQSWRGACAGAEYAKCLTGTILRDQEKERKWCRWKFAKKWSRRSTSNDFISYFSEKHEREISLRQEELKLKKQELDLQAQQMQQAQQIQQAQFLLIQQQSSVMLEILKSMNQKQWTYT